MNRLKILGYLLTEKERAVRNCAKDGITEYKRGYWNGQIDCIDDIVAWLQREGGE